MQAAELAMHILQFDMHAGQFVALAHDNVLLVKLPEAGRSANNKWAEHAHPEARTIGMATQQGHKQQDDGHGSDHGGHCGDR
ncbi:hypothetical protein GCM10007920_43540 [Ciceribacter naphthalenivorans]|uniref:Uncharacterized protein n=2 Tax=Alphaproteobacteria TaxID=28211 RepID=A0A512HI31_9HYPH|nr:hypothetical protein RNA01_20380 [Ciceribacter naphthalenivorans]GLR24560.1 hypothetical protein GCM10007920_43540 [Ciceribacter naphthalenivorans]GLT07416.1 hypothetical protein GCM10007926_43540 [Sphingomonas psychrolutea]